ncbi:MAG: PadR family transcriptional regulator [Desulfosudis oleivorans]|nr:PadR family transcriptional regulator [Desulfosudis oleivorans]
MIEELAHHGYELSPGTLYPILHAMEAAGYLASEQELVAGKLRRYYAITPARPARLGGAQARVGRAVVSHAVHNAGRPAGGGPATPNAARGTPRAGRCVAWPAASGRRGRRCRSRPARRPRRPHARRQSAAPVRPSGWPAATTAYFVNSASSAAMWRASASTMLMKGRTGPKSADHAPVGLVGLVLVVQRGGQGLLFGVVQCGCRVHGVGLSRRVDRREETAWRSAGQGPGVRPPRRTHARRRP